MHFMIESTIMTATDKQVKPENTDEGLYQIEPLPAIVGAVILAAGGSTRMGEPKQLLVLQGKPMLRRVTETVCAAGLRQVVVVVGAHAQLVKQAISNLDVDLVINDAWPEGMSTSVRTGIRALEPEIQAVLLVLADQPALSPDLLQAMIARYHATGARIVAPYYEGRRGNPVLFDSDLFPELLSIEGDQGARAVIARHKDAVERVEIEDSKAFVDVDTHQDYEAMRTTGIGQ